MLIMGTSPTYSLARETVPSIYKVATVISAVFRHFKTIDQERYFRCNTFGKHRHASRSRRFHHLTKFRVPLKSHHKNTKKPSTHLMIPRKEHHRVADVRSVTYRNGSGTRSGWLAAAPCVANAWRGRPLQPAHLRPQTTHYNNCVQGNHHYTHALYRLHQEQHHPLLPGNNTSRGNGSERGRG